MSHDDTTKALADLMGVLADPTRLRIVFHLAASPMIVGQLASSMDLQQPAVSHHLMLLRVHGLVRQQRREKTVLYSLGPTVRARARSIGFVIGKQTVSIAY